MDMDSIYVADLERLADDGNPLAATFGDFGTDEWDGPFPPDEMFREAIQLPPAALAWTNEGKAVWDAPDEIEWHGREDCLRWFARNGIREFGPDGAGLVHLSDSQLASLRRQLADFLWENAR